MGVSLVTRLNTESLDESQALIRTTTYHWCLEVGDGECVVCDRLSDRSSDSSGHSRNYLKVRSGVKSFPLKY